jgi:hypothetical protein
MGGPHKKKDEQSESSSNDHISTAGLLICFLAIPAFLEIFVSWQGVFRFGTSVNDLVIFIPNIYSIANEHFLLILAGFGIISGLILGDSYLRGFRYQRHGPNLRAGCWKCCRAAAIISLVIGICTYINYYYLQDFRQPEHPGYQYYSPMDYGSIFENIILYAFTFVLLVTVSAYIFMKFFTDERQEIKRKKIIKNSGRILIILIFLPVFIAFIGIGMGFIERTPDLYLNWNMSVERTANDTVVITNNGFYYPNDIDLSKYLSSDTTYIIYINGKKASDSSAAGRSHANLTIKPDTGLRIEPGQNVTFVGQEVGWVNDTHIEIVLVDKNEICIYDRYTMI